MMPKNISSEKETFQPEKEESSVILSEEEVLQLESIKALNFERAMRDEDILFEKWGIC